MNRTVHVCVFLLLGLLAVQPRAAAAGPGDYKAQRFDVVARAVDGALDVNETIAFEFQSGTFTKAWREIPVSRTDGIAVLGAALDGVALTEGDGPGQYAVTRRNGKVRVEWRFPEVGPSVHRFELHYQAKGVVYRDGGSDVVRWRALPQEHRYAIDASRIEFEPAGATVRPLETRRVGSATISTSAETATIDAASIQTNGWIIAELRYPAGQIAAADPAWRQRDVRAAATAPRWVLAGAGAGVAGLILLLLMRQGYPAPAGMPADTTSTEPPQPLPAALASMLTAKGGIAGHQPAATLLDLADRGVLRVREVPRTFGRSYELSQVPGSHDLEPHEQEALTIAFAGGGEDVTLAKARGRLTRQSRRVSAAVNAELAARGLVDPDRQAVRDRVTRTGLAMLLGAAFSAVAVAPLIPRFEGWPFLIPLGVLVAALAGLVMGASMTTLSDRGLVEAARWRGFKRHLKSLASRRDAGGAAVPSRWIVYAIATGLGPAWSRYLKRHPDAAPAWFIAAGDDPGAAFAAFVGSESAGAHGAGGSAGGAAAGGGGSGAG